MDHVQALDPDNPDRAGTVWAVVGSLEVNGDERPVGRREREGMGRAAWGHGRSDSAGHETFQPLL